MPAVRLQNVLVLFHPPAGAAAFQSHSVANQIPNRISRAAFTAVERALLVRRTTPYLQGWPRSHRRQPDAVAASGICFANLRMPVPASKTSRVPSLAQTSTVDVLPPYRFVSAPGADFGSNWGERGHSCRIGRRHSPNAAFTALLSQHRMLVGVPFALHTEPHAKRSEIKSHKVQIQNQLHNATFRQKGIYAPKRGFSGPSIGRCAPCGTKEMRLRVNAAATFGLHIGPSGLFVARL
jgi:hypothetical protein